MSTTPLTDIQEVIERTVFETIREELVDKQYLPDISTFPDTEAGETSYLQAFNQIVSDKGFAIELFNESTNFDKGIKAKPRIVIKTGSFLAGNLGGDPIKFFEEQISGTYSSFITPPQTSDFFLNVHLVSGSSNQERILHSILSLALPKRKYLKLYNDSGKSFFIQNINYFEQDNLDQGIIEKVYAYQIPDCWDSENIELESGLSRITEITLDPMVMKYMDGDIGNNSDPLVVT